jgi:hypothetical protein
LRIYPSGAEHGFHGSLLGTQRRFRRILTKATAPEAAEQEDRPARPTKGLVERDHPDQGFAKEEEERVDATG